MRDSSKPPLPGRLRYETFDMGRRHCITARPQRYWSLMIFLLFWLTGWSFGGLFAITALFGGSAGIDGGIFLGFWLCGWTLGWVFAAGKIYWMIAGSMRLSVEGAHVIYQWGVPGMRRSKEFAASEMSNLRTPGHGLEFDHGTKTEIIMPTITHEEADFVAEWLRQKLPRLRK